MNTTLEQKIMSNDQQFVLTQIKRTNKAAMYKREGLDGSFVCYEVFAIMTKNGNEVYPNPSSFNKWAWCPVSEERANQWYDRLNKGEIVIPQVDPETSEPISLEKDPSLDEIMSETDPITEETQPVVPVTEQTPVIEQKTEPVVENVVEDPTIPPIVEKTMDNKPAVTVAKVSKTKVQMIIPSGEFTQAQFAQMNGLPERGVVFGKIQTEIRHNRIKMIEQRKINRGRPTNIYMAVADSK